MQRAVVARRGPCDPIFMVHNVSNMLHIVDVTVPGVGMCCTCARQLAFYTMSLAPPRVRSESAECFKSLPLLPVATLLNYSPTTQTPSQTRVFLSAAVNFRLVKPCLVLQPVVVNMSAKSSSQGVQAALESKMVSVHKNLFGAPEGKTNVIFVDDVNLPARDAFDSQPPVELLRQLVSASYITKTRDNIA